MQLIHTVSELRARLSKEAEIAFVPTMGNLHHGHLALVERAKVEAKCVVVSIFVNPLQFIAGEDFLHYPRTLDDDCEQLAKAGADVVFAPSIREVYVDFDEKALHQTMTVTPHPMSNILCGKSRPGHFTGVATVVMKLFHMVQPQVAVFGKKDYQQLLLVRALVRQFNMPIKIVAGETMRDSDGLALSSRNSYLSAQQRKQAVQLYQTLVAIALNLKAGLRTFEKLCDDAQLRLKQAGWQVDYIDIRNAHDLQEANAEDGDWVVLGAAALGNTRLIDNIEVNIMA